ncbi:glutamate synthase large subunit [Thermomicrobiaceae bacterium CFH 74404]|uniref:Glutamate synthase [NADPH] large chain n=1 Tax=Thermalbibacter longus TaxID=2951981 RepID=A0AA41WCF3_9BACT|nr:glutamate synthase large subunit [Thermalbibacter longus]MCM8747909.1 glutamate synthase large subunit [Thermalbibacter longus]
MQRSAWDARAAQAPLYRPEYEHDACGTGFVADLSGKPSHQIVQYALEAVVNLTHRGAVDADAKTGDGAGITIQLPRRLLARELARLTGLHLDPADLAAGVVFLPAHDSAGADACQAALEQALAAQGSPALVWRPVPVRPEVLGLKARETMPAIWQVITARPSGLDTLEFERRLYLARRLAERFAKEQSIAGFFVPSLSCRTLVYKGLFVARDLGDFYLDLRDPEFESALALFHQRYSTNTFPTWHLAQPFRRLAHNGEINTLQGNRNWMRAREPELASEVWGERIADVLPLIDPTGSDSMSLDNVLELIELSGRDILHAVAMLIPEAWENMPAMDEDLRGFYAYHAGLMEPWDGPAAIAFTDGRIAGAVLDRNGLRPARYSVTEDGLVVLASETGVIDLSGRQVIERGRLGPGQMLAVDVETGQLWRNEEIKAQLAARRPYREWVRSGFYRLSPARSHANGHEHDGNGQLARQIAFGFSAEDQRLVIHPMAAEAKEPLWSMGDDAPLAVLSRFPRPLAHFFRQRFAQVTNPPIDPLREKLVMSLDVYLGPRKSMLAETPEHARLLHLPSPVLLEPDFAALQSLDRAELQPVTLRAVFPVAAGPAGLQAALETLLAEAERAVDAGATILIVSDRDVDSEHAPIPMPLAVGGIHHHLIRAGKRMRASIVCDTGDVWDVHQAAVLIGYGASAIHPYLALEAARALAGTRGCEELSADDLAIRYKKSLDAGLLKVMSKMGISTLASYQGAQLFEIIGLAPEVVERFFTGTPARLAGLDLAGIAERVLQRHREAYCGEATKLPDYGMVRFRKDGEYHAYSPTNVRALQQVAESGDRERYRAYVRLVEEREPATLRDLLAFKPTTPVPLEEVEPAEEIRRRFVVTAMSLGALSPEAFRTLAIAMNRIGARSNSGEGGEDPDWYYEPGPDTPHSRIKQVASARFGVTTEYLTRADELEIKIAQGSKPGEGGQLPAHKVTALIARLRHAIPGISLISPPPHHDIYSIEDLAQLIYDLKQVNPRARVGVKLVAEAGVGTIAAGVAKAHADYILISGHSGGTGASPLSSIKYAGVPWELGLAETQQTLVLNDLRSRVRLRTDGGLQTARDVVIAALLGAEEFGFGTAALVAIGCDMARQCHLNTCPTGIATQREDLRARFKGTPEQVINFFTQLAEDVRHYLAQLGARRLDEIVGRVELLEQAKNIDGPGATLDLSPILAVPGGPDAPRRCLRERNDFDDVSGPPLDDQILEQALPAIEEARPVRITAQVRNHHRAVGARLAGTLSLRYGRERPPAGLIELQLTGQAGQSFGAWCTHGLRLILDGDANDYVGKGMAGGEIIVRPREEPVDESRPHVIVGNTVLYGATGGELYVAGQAGERFAVRNSGAVAVVEGVGDHGCEYMTAGTVVVLGETGRNFASGMTNGIAYVLDLHGTFPARYNSEYVGLERVTEPEDAERLHSLIERHVAWTGSRRGQQILAHWQEYLPRFWKVVPHPAIEAPAEQPVRRARQAVAAASAAD